MVRSGPGPYGDFTTTSDPFGDPFGDPLGGGDGDWINVEQGKNILDRLWSGISGLWSDDVEGPCPGQPSRAYFIAAFNAAPMGAREELLAAWKGTHGDGRNNHWTVYDLVAPSKVDHFIRSAMGGNDCKQTTGTAKAVQMKEKFLAFVSQYGPGGSGSGYVPPGGGGGGGNDPGGGYNPGGGGGYPYPQQAGLPGWLVLGLLAGGVYYAAKKL